MNRRLAVVFCMLWCVLLIQFIFEKQPFSAEAKDLVNIMEELGLDSLEANIELTGELGRSFSKRRAEQVLKAAAQTLGIESTSEILTEERTNGTVWTISGFLSGDIPGSYGWKADVKVFAVQDGFFADYYFQAAATGNGVTAWVRERMETVKRNLDLDSLVCLRVSGSCGRILASEEKEQWESLILEELDAKRIKEAKEDNLSMVYAYNKKLGEAVRVGNEQVNLNVMFRDNGSVTRCFVGLPVVTSDD